MMFEFVWFFRCRYGEFCVLCDGRRGGSVSHVVAVHFGVVEGRGGERRGIFVRWRDAELVLMFCSLVGKMD
jgi:hypothetical protein